MSDNWLSKEISEIITSPHISFPKPPPGIHLGPGPVDLFTTRFNNVFALDVKATVAGKEVSREELKAALLGLQKYWEAGEVKLQDESAGPVCCFGHCQMVHTCSPSVRSVWRLSSLSPLARPSLCLPSRSQCLSSFLLSG